MYFTLLLGCSNFDGKQDGKCDIISAIKRGDVECVENLLAQGCDLEVTDPDWDIYGPVAIAAGKGYTHLVEILLAAGMDVNGTIAGKGDRASPLAEACRHSYMETMETLIKGGANVNAEPNAMYREPPLHIAVENNRLDAVELLVNSGASVDLTFHGLGDRGGTALCKAAYRGHAEMVEFLISLGTDLKIPATEGRTALMEASRSHSNEAARCVQLLIRAGAEINTKTTFRKSALVFAAKNENKLIIEMLLVANAQVIDECEGCGGDCLGCEERLSSVLSEAIRFHKNPDTILSCSNLAYAAGMEVPWYFVDELRNAIKSHNVADETVTCVLRDNETLCSLTEICRKTIRQHLLNLISPSVDHAGFNNLFVAVPKLPLPEVMKDFLLFNIKPQSPWEPLPTT